MFTPIRTVPCDAFIRQLESGYLTHHPQVSYCRVAFNRQVFSDDNFRRYGITAPQQVMRSVDKRKAEYLAGRYCCATLLTERGLPAVVKSGPDRAPCWPQGISGALSHSEEQAIALIAPQDCCPGVDLEAFDGEAMRDAASLIASVDERARLRAGPLEYEQALLLAFSAKESLYKALYPRVKRFLGFDSASLINIDSSAGRFTLILNKTLTPRFQEGFSTEGHYQFDGEMITTLVIC